MGGGLQITRNGQKTVRVNQAGQAVGTGVHAQSLVGRGTLDGHRGRSRAAGCAEEVSEAAAWTADGWGQVTSGRQERFSEWTNCDTCCVSGSERRCGKDGNISKCKHVVIRLLTRFKYSWTGSSKAILKASLQDWPALSGAPVKGGPVLKTVAQGQPSVTGSRKDRGQSR